MDEHTSYITQPLVQSICYRCVLNVDEYTHKIQTSIFLHKETAFPTPIAELPWVRIPSEESALTETIKIKSTLEVIYNTNT